jgi:hypothetical protein
MRARLPCCPYGRDQLTEWPHDHSVLQCSLIGPKRIRAADLDVLNAVEGRSSQLRLAVGCSRDARMV